MTGTRKSREELAEEWWINFPGDPRVDPGTCDEYHGWADTHSKAFLAGYDAAEEKAKVLVEALEKICEQFPKDYIVRINEIAIIALAEYRGEK